MNVQELLQDPQKIEKICRNYFDSVDKNKNGILEYKEIKVILAKFAEQSNSIQPPEEDIKDAFKKLDANKDNKISYLEFKSLFNKYLDRIYNKK